MKSSITLPSLYLYILANTNMWCSALYVEEDPVRIAIDQNETFKSPLILAIEFKKPKERREAKTSFKKKRICVGFETSGQLSQESTLSNIG